MAGPYVSRARRVLEPLEYSLPRREYVPTLADGLPPWSRGTAVAHSIGRKGPTLGDGEKSYHSRASPRSSVARSLNR